MFQYPALTTQFAADRRRAHTAAADAHRIAERVGHDETMTATRQVGTVVRFARGDAVDERVAAAGIDAAARQVDAVVRRARCAGVGLRLVAIVADPTQPAVARERALGRLLATLDAAPARSGRMSHPAA